MVKIVELKHLTALLRTLNYDESVGWYIEGSDPLFGKMGSSLLSRAHFAVRSLPSPLPPLLSSLSKHSV